MAGHKACKKLRVACHQWSDAFPSGRHPLPAIADHVLIVPEGRSEDCLFLNIWTPAADNARRPVMVWLHGGGLENGSGGQPNYDGSSLAKNEDVVVVTLNMRLGPFGYLRLKELTDGRIPSTGNEGRLDEIAALQWLRDNIDRFGGDPDNVTIFGQSAGAIEVAALLASPKAEGLFNRAILHSTAAHSSQSVRHATDIARLFLETAGVDPEDTTALLSLTPDQLTRASVGLLAAMVQLDPKLGKMHFNPVVDGDLLVERPIDAIRHGTAKGVDVMVGTTLDETRIGLGSEPAMELDAATVEGLVGVWLDNEASAAIDAYQGFLKKRGAQHGPTDIQLAIETDRVLRQPAILLSEALAERGTPGYHFLVTQPSPAYGGRLGSCHAVELPLLFGTHTDPSLAPFSGSGPEADAFSVRIQKAWAAFAREGDPSLSDLAWPRYDAERQTMVMGKTWSVKNAPFEAERRYWHNIEVDPSLGIM